MREDAKRVFQHPRLFTIGMACGSVDAMKTRSIRMPYKRRSPAPHTFLVTQIGAVLPHEGVFQQPQALSQVTGLQGVLPSRHYYRPAHRRIDPNGSNECNIG